jgi:release factor glutamine methyltransferase
MTTRIDNWLAKVVNTHLPISENLLLEAQLLTAHVTHHSRSWVASHPEYIFSQQEESLLNNLLARFVSGEPLPYLLGHWEFYGLDFFLSQGVLIPRPETEILVDTALGWLSQNPQCRLAADVGTGSACIAVSLAHRFKDLKVIATDISRLALMTAMRNILHYELSSQIFPVQTDLLSGFTGPFDLVCANLPYIPSHKLFSLPVSRYEPALSLDGGPDGLDIILNLLLHFKKQFAKDGLILLEIEAEQGMAISQLARLIFPEADIHLKHDLAGHPRVISIYH